MYLKLPWRRLSGAFLNASLRFLLPACLMIALIGAQPAHAQDSREKEDIEAAMIFAASKFVTWPAPSASSFDVCIAGEGKLAQAIQKYAGKRLKGAEVKIRPLQENDSPAGCRVMVMPQEAEAREKQRLESFKQQPFLTIGETGNFTESGGIMRFLLVDGKVRFEINLDAAKKAGLTLGSQMVGLAVSVKGGK